MKMVAAIIARAQSPLAPANLLPQRSLAIINGRTVLEWILLRLKRCTRINNIVVAVGDREQDQRIILLAEKKGIKVYAGHPDDILYRLLMVAEQEDADHVIRINGNFPLIDPVALDSLTDCHFKEQSDFSLNSHYHGVVYGLGAEIISRMALESAVKEPRGVKQKSAGAKYLHQNPEKYKTIYQTSSHTAPHLRVSIDFEPDLKVVSEILANIHSPDNAGIIDFLNKRPELVAAQELTVPAEVSLEKALLFPEKIKALRRNNCVTFDTTYPISVELSLTNKCNHKCIWCSDESLRSRLGGTLEFEKVKSLIEELKEGGSKGIVIEGGGEPTLHPDFFSIVNEIKNKGLAPGLITNGYIQPPNPINDFEWIRVSLDASSRDQYYRTKGVDGFNQVINNLMTMSVEKSSTTLGVGYVLTNLNDNPVKLEQLVLFLKKIGINYIHFRPVVDHPELQSQADLNYLKKYETQDFSINIAAMIDNKDYGNSGLPCLAHSLSTVITADGGVFLCGRLNSFESWEPLGNLHNQSFNKIWTGDKRRQQVKKVSQASFCRSHCPQCRMTKYNRLLNDIERIKTRNFI